MKKKTIFVFINKLDKIIKTIVISVWKVVLTELKEKKNERKR